MSTYTDDFQPGERDFLLTLGSVPGKPRTAHVARRIAENMLGAYGSNARVDIVSLTELAYEDGDVVEVGVEPIGILIRLEKQIEPSVAYNLASAINGNPDYAWQKARSAGT